MKDKKSQTDILVTVLLVLIALAVVAIVAYFVVNQVRTSTSEAQLKSKSFEVYVKKAEVNDGFLRLSLERGSSNENFTGLKIVLTSSSGKSQTYNYTGYLNPLETQEISIPLNGNLINSGSIVADVYPVLIFNSETRIAPKTSGMNAVKTNDASDKSNLVAYYPFDNDAKDYSGNGNDGVNSGATLISSGKVGGAYQFNGYNSFVNTNKRFDFNKTEEFSVCFWINSNNHSYKATAAAGLVGKGHYYDNTWDIFLLNTHTIRFEVSGNPTRNGYMSLDTTALSLNIWYYYCATYYQGQMMIYLNSSFQSLGTYVGMGDLNGNRDVKIGAREADMSRVFNGSIDEVRIYNRALSPEEVKAIYDASK